VGRFLLRRLRLGRCLHLRRLGLSLLGLRRAWLLAGLILAAAPAAAMPLRRPKTICLGRPHLWLGLGRFCRHACTSWHISLLRICVAGPSFPKVGARSLCAPRVLVGRGNGGEQLLFPIRNRRDCGESLLARNQSLFPWNYSLFTASVALATEADELCDEKPNKRKVALPGY